MLDKFGERVKSVIRNWLDVQPASAQSIRIQESTTFESDVYRSQLWYRGDAEELQQFFKQLITESPKTGFWARSPAFSKIRKIHSGIPAVIIDTLAYIVKSDLGDVEFDPSWDGKLEWETITESLDFTELVGDAIVDTLVDGDGAFKISIDPSASPVPIVEFYGADRVEYDTQSGIIKAIVFKTVYKTNGQPYELRERYSKGRIESELFDANGKPVSFGVLEELKGLSPVVEYNGDYMMAVPVRFYKSKKHYGRGKSVFDGGKSDCFDALDEVISQWWDALRDGRVQKYIPQSMIPTDPETGKLLELPQFGSEYITVSSPIVEGCQPPKIEVVQPDIKYDSFISSYSIAMLMCLQGLVSPATLGIDVGKMSSADAQREKKDVTGNTRNTITTALEKALPELVSAILKTYDNMQKQSPKEYKPIVSFGEYGAPDFDSRIESVGKASTFGIMSIETQVDELWGGSKDDEWKREETMRIMAEKGFMPVDGDPAVGDGVDDI